MKHRLRATLCLLLLFAVNCGRATDFEIDAAFPGGNITVDRVEGEAVFLRQDLRDTLGDWFYWAFRVRGAAGRTATDVREVSAGRGAAAPVRDAATVRVADARGPDAGRLDVVAWVREGAEPLEERFVTAEGAFRDTSRA